MKVLELKRENVDVLLETENISVLEDTGIRLDMWDGGMYEIYYPPLSFSFEVVVLYRTHGKGEKLYLLQTEEALEKEAFVVQSADVPLVLPYGKVLDFLLSKVREERVHWVLFLKGLEKLDIHSGIDVRKIRRFEKRLKQKIKAMYPNKRMDDGFIFEPQKFREIMEFCLRGLAGERGGVS